MQHVIVHGQSLLQREVGEAVAATRQLPYVRHKEGAELVIDARGSTPFVRGVGG